MADLSTIRERAEQHQRDLDQQRTSLVPDDLAKRWSLSVSTVKDIPFDRLPYLRFGKGGKRRRYRLADVESFERRQLNPADQGSAVA